MSKLIKPRNEFRKLNDKAGNGHPAYIYAQVGNDYLYIGITHGEYTFGHKNIPLSHNPNGKDKTRAFVRGVTLRANRSAFGARLKGWSFTAQDKKIIRAIIEKRV